jgi:hypothetical protein
MDEVISDIVDHVVKKNIKVITISEPNHRSYTSHTFNFRLMKKLLHETGINTFSTEKLGVFDAMVLNYYIKNNLPLPKNIEREYRSLGLGTKRWVNYFRKLKRRKVNFVGGEFNYYDPHLYEKEILEEYFSEEFVDSIFDPIEGGGDIKAVTENDKLAKASFECIKDFYSNRESFWKLNIRRILEKYDNLFIVGFHLEKGEPIGKMIQEMYPKNSLFLGSCALNIKTQILTISDRYASPEAFNKALETRNYKETVEEIDKWVPPTNFEKRASRGGKDFRLIKVTKSNQEQKIRGIGCFIAMISSEKEKEKKITDVFTSLKNFDFIVFIRDSVYEENMFI